jgi:L-ascorbate metabolism protein UlaG (beta-lactamase superfamily)
MDTDKALDEITWFGHASFLIHDKLNDKNIYYLDPYDLKEKPKKEQADIIFVTHAHYDHFSPKDIEKILDDETIVVAVNGCEGLKLPKERFVITEPSKEFTLKGIKIKTVPAYNINPERLQFHPKANKWVGYILEVNNSKIYHAGDTDFIPEMKNLGKVNVALLPMGGTYTMDVDESIQATNAIKAEITVPMHYRALLKDFEDSEKKFKAGVKGRVEILDEVA